MSLFIVAVDVLLYRERAFPNPQLSLDGAFCFGGRSLSGFSRFEPSCSVWVSYALVLHT